MNGETEEREKRKAERIAKDAAKFQANLQITRPGFGAEYSSKTGAKIELNDSLNTGSDRIELSGILWLDPAPLRDNPYNDYPPLSGEELRELARDIAQKGVLVPLIVRLSEDVLICGHNRRRASVEAKESQVPVQRVLRLLTESEERDIMKSENDRRRGGNWTKEKKEEFIREHFGDVIHNVTHGGDRRKAVQDSVNLESQNQNFSEVPGTTTKTGVETAGPGNQDSMNLAAAIEKKSRGNITKGTAQRIMAGMRKERPTPSNSAQKGGKPLTEKELKRGEKLALHLKTLRNTRSLLEEKLANVKEEEKKALKELKSIGQPGLFGVET
jgi:hypothetical protein